MKKIDKLKLIELAFSIISIFTCLISDTVNGYNILFILPFCYFICRLFIKWNNNMTIGTIALNFLTFLKYSVMPFMIIIMQDYYNGNLTGEIPEASYLHKAIVLLCIECLTVFITRFIYEKKEKKLNFESNQSIKKILFGPIMILFMIISVFVACLFWKAFFPNQIFMIDSTYESVKIDFNFDGLIKIIFFLFKVFGMLYFIQEFYFKYKKNAKLKYVIGIIITLLIYLALNTSTSRWSLIVPILVIVYILRDVWFENQKNKTLLLVIGGILIISFMSISIYKFDWLFKCKTINNIELKDVVNIFGGQMQEYFSGPRAVAQGIETSEIYSSYITINTLINDFVGSVPLLSGYINQSDRINIYYNYFLKGTKREATQIMPTISIGYAYFYYPLCPIFIIIFILVCLKCGEVAEIKGNIFEKYIYGFLSIWCAMCLGFNTQIIFGWICSNFIPFLIIVILNKKYLFIRLNN